MLATTFFREPLQSITESHLLGYNHGLRNGDVVAGKLNYQFYLQILYLSGENLTIARDKSRDLANGLLQRKQKFLLNGASCLYLQAVAFIEGLEFEEKQQGPTKIPRWEDMAKSRSSFHLDFTLVVSVVTSEPGTTMLKVSLTLHHFI